MRMVHIYHCYHEINVTTMMADVVILAGLVLMLSSFCFMGDAGGYELLVQSSLSLSSSFFVGAYKDAHYVRRSRRRRSVVNDLVSNELTTESYGRNARRRRRLRHDGKREVFLYTPLSISFVDNGTSNTSTSNSSRSGDNNDTTVLFQFRLILLELGIHVLSSEEESTHHTTTGLRVLFSDEQIASMKVSEEEGRNHKKENGNNDDDVLILALTIDQSKNASAAAAVSDTEIPKTKLSTKTVRDWNSRHRSLLVRAVDNQEAMQERYIAMVSDPSYICNDDIIVCARKTRTKFYSSYQKPDTIYQRLDDLVTNHTTDWIRKSSIGKTYEGREQVIYTITNYNRTEHNESSSSAAGVQDRNTIFYFCGTHPRELVATMTCPYIIEQLLLEETTKKNGGLLNEITFVILPIFNVDGLHYVYQYHTKDYITELRTAMDENKLHTKDNFDLWQTYRSARLWRKTMQKNTVRCEAATTWTDLGISAWESALLPPYDPQLCTDDIKYWGTDLNRNFPSHWMGGGSSSFISDDKYGGLYAGDQIETQNMMTFLHTISDTLLSSVDVHCCSEMWLVPTGWHPCKTKYDNRLPQCAETYGESFDKLLNDQWSQHVADAIYDVNGTRFAYGDVASVIYPASGSGMDWMYETFGTMYLSTTEIRKDPRTYNKQWNGDLLYNFGPQTDFILPSISELYTGMIASVQFALTKAKERISDVNNFPIEQPGYPIEYICDNVGENEKSMCDMDCTDIDVFPFGLSESDRAFVLPSLLTSPLSSSSITTTDILSNYRTVRVEQEREDDGKQQQQQQQQQHISLGGVNPCGKYLRSFKNGKPDYISVEKGTIFRQICPKDCDVPSH